MHKQFLCFSQHQRTLAIDLRGHGDSDVSEQEYTIDAFTDDLAWMVDELGLDRPVIAGHSLGAYIALDFAAKHGDRTRGIVMMDPPPIATPDVLQSIFGGLADALAESVEPTRTEFSRQFFLPRCNEALQEEILAHLRLANDAVTVNSWRNMCRFDALAAANACKVPTLNIAATPGFNVREEVEAIIEHCVSGRTIGGGHNHQLEVADQVNSMIRNFIREYCD